MACHNHKIAGVMQTVNSADGVLEAKNAPVTDESANSEGPNNRKKGEPSEQSTTEAIQFSKMCLI